MMALTQSATSMKDSFACLQNSAQTIEKRMVALDEQLKSLQTMKKTVIIKLSHTETSVQHINSELEQYKLAPTTATATATATVTASPVSIIGGVSKISSILYKGTVAATSSLLKILPSHTEDDTLNQLRDLLKTKMRELANYRALSAEIDRSMEEISATLQQLAVTLKRIKTILPELKDLTQVCDGISLKEELLFANMVQLVELYESSEGDTT